MLIEFSGRSGQYSLVTTEALEFLVYKIEIQENSLGLLKVKQIWDRLQKGILNWKKLM